MPAGGAYIESAWRNGMTLTETKTANAEAFRRDFAARAECPGALPTQIDFETTTRCNLRCFTCTKTYAREAGRDADIGLFERMAEALFPTARSINLTGYGEPMVSPHFERFFDRAAEAGLSVGFITNGTLFDERWMERFAAAECHLFLSLDGATPETMAAMRPGVNLGRLLECLGRWRRLRDSQPHPRSRLLLNFVATLRNVHELPAVVELAAEYGAARVEVLNFWTANVGAVAVREHLRNDPARARRFFAEARERASEAGVGLILPPGYEGPVTHASAEEIAATSEAPVEVAPAGAKYPLACSAPWFRVSVKLDGAVYPCCWYPWALGDLTREPFGAIWHGAAYRRLRRRIDTRFPSLGCKECQLVWGIAAGQPEAIFRREGPVDRLHTAAQRLRRRWAAWRRRRRGA